MKKRFKSVITLLILFFGLSFYSVKVLAQNVPGLPDNLPLKVEKKDTVKKDTVKKVSTKLKSYAGVINKSFKSQRGLFTVHKNKDTLYFEIPDSILHRDIMFMERLTQASYGISASPGENMGSKTIVFEKGPDSTLLINNNLSATEADTSSNIYKALRNANINPNLAVLPIVALGKDSASYVVDVTALFKAKSFLTDAKYELDTAKHTSDFKDYHVDYLHSYPGNVEIGVSHNLSITKEKLPASMQINSSFVILPKVPLMRRYADERVGYFSSSILPFSDDQQRIQWQNFITRWRLEPRAVDVKKWQHGDLVEPVKPIIIYLDPATPKQWRPYLIQGINDWQKAFEQAGFKNAIIGKEWPVGDTTMHMDDARYSFLNYVTSEGINAYTPEIHDPRTGEILQVHISWNAGMMSQLHTSYMVQAGAVDPRARKARFNTELMGQLVRYASSHEVGHSLGLRHNYGSSSQTAVAHLRDKKFLEKYGHTASIMDFARFNYVAQPVDGISEKGILPRIGEYDKWAIEWGYKPSNALNADEDKLLMRRLTDNRLSRNRILWFGDGESQQLKFDPRAQVDDLGNDPVVAGNYGILNLKRVLRGLPEWTKEDGRANENLAEAYDNLKLQYLKYMGHVLKYTPGGYYRNNISERQKEPVFVSEPILLQKRALEFFNSQLFNTPKWLINTAIIDRVKGAGGVDFLDDIQAKVLNSLLEIKKFTQIRSNMERFGKKTLPLNSYIATLHRYIWTELKKPGIIKEDVYRRNIQKTYFGAMVDFLSSDAAADDTENDAASIVKADLLALAKELKHAALRTKDPLTLYHFNDMYARIQSALDKKDI